MKSASEPTTLPYERAQILKTLSNFSKYLPLESIPRLVNELQLHHPIIKILYEMQKSDNDMILWSLRLLNRLLFSDGIF